VNLGLCCGRGPGRAGDAACILPSEDAGNTTPPCVGHREAVKVHRRRQIFAGAAADSTMSVLAKKDVIRGIGNAAISADAIAGSRDHAAVRVDPLYAAHAYSAPSLSWVTTSSLSQGRSSTVAPGALPTTFARTMLPSLCSHVGPAECRPTVTPCSISDATGSRNRHILRRNNCGPSHPRFGRASKRDAYANLGGTLDGTLGGADPALVGHHDAFDRAERVLAGPTDARVNRRVDAISKCRDERHIILSRCAATTIRVAATGFERRPIDEHRRRRTVPVCCLAPEVSGSTRASHGIPGGVESGTAMPRASSAASPSPAEAMTSDNAVRESAAASASFLTHTILPSSSMACPDGGRIRCGNSSRRERPPRRGYSTPP
jgi:hypothetical protein